MYSYICTTVIPIALVLAEHFHSFLDISFLDLLYFEDKLMGGIPEAYFLQISYKLWHIFGNIYEIVRQDCKFLAWNFEVASIVLDGKVLSVM